MRSPLCIGAWIYLWAFYFVPLIYISVFVPVPYCLDDYGFVVEPKVRQVFSSSSILPQECFGYSRFFVFPYKLSNYLFQLCEEYHWQLDRDCNESINFFGQYTHFHILQFGYAIFYSTIFLQISFHKFHFLPQYIYGKHPCNFMIETFLSIQYSHRRSVVYVYFYFNGFFHRILSTVQFIFLLAIHYSTFVCF